MESKIGLGRIVLPLVLLTLLTAPVLASSPIIVQWGASAFSIDGLASVSLASRVANVSVPIVNSGIGYAGYCTLLLDENGDLWAVGQCDTFPGQHGEPLTIGDLLSRGGSVARVPDAFRALMPRPIVEMALGCYYYAVLDDANNLYLWRVSASLSDLPLPTRLQDLPPRSSVVYQSLTVPAPSNDTKFSHVFSTTAALAVISQDGLRAYVLHPSDTCQVGFTRDTAIIDTISPVNVSISEASSDRIRILKISPTTHGVMVVGDSSVYIWGKLGALGRGYGKRDLTCTVTEWTPSLLDLSSLLPSPSSVVTDVVVLEWFTMLILDDKTVISVDYLGAQLDPPLTALLRSSTSAKISASTAGYHVLLADGTVWSRVIDGAYTDYNIRRHLLLGSYLQPNSSSVRTLTAEGPLIRADFYPAVPSSFKITRIMAEAEGYMMYALASPNTTQALNAPDLPILVPKETIQNGSLVYWGSCPYASRTPSNVGSSGGDPHLRVVFDSLADVQHLPAEFQRFKKVAYDNNHALLLTETGKIAMWGVAEPGVSAPLNGEIGLSPTMGGISYAVPTPLSNSFFNDMAILDVAVALRHSLVLASNGSVVWWGDSTFPSSSAKRDSSSSSESDFTTDSYSSTTKRATSSLSASPTTPTVNFGAWTQWMSPPENGVTFTSVLAYGSTMGAIDSMGRLWYLRSTDVSTFTQSNVTLDVTDFIGMLNRGYAIFSDGELHVFSFSWTSGSDIPYNCTSTSTDADGMTCTVPTNDGVILSNVRLVEMVGADQAIMLDDIGLIAVGGHPSWSSQYGFLTNLTRLEFNVNVDAASVIGLSVNDNNIYLHYSNGTVLATCGDLLSNCLSGLTLKPILSSYKVRSIVSGRFSTDCTIALVEAPAPSSRNFSAAHFLNIVAGSNGFGAFGDGTGGMAVNVTLSVLPEGHPLESATASDISFGNLVSMTDGTLPNGDRRWLRWGDTTGTTLPIASSLYMPSYMRMPDLLPDEEILKVVSVGSAHLIALKNCTMIYMTTLDSYQYPFLYYSSYRWMPNEAVNDDPDFQPKYFRQHTANISISFQTLPNSGICEAEGQGLADIKCSSDYPNAFAASSDIWCLMRTNNDSFISMAWYRSYTGGGLNCSTGLFGDVAECAAHAPGIPNSANFLVDTTSNLSGLAGLTVAQYEVSARHAIFLTTNGTLLALGSNDGGRLGLPVAQHRVAIRPTVVPLPSSVGAGSITKIVLSRHSTHLLVSNSSIVSWGDNTHGLLGNGKSRDEIPFSDSPVDTIVPSVNITDLVCSAYCCYALYENGNVYSWGYAGMNSLGRPISDEVELHDRYFSTPGRATEFVFPGPSRRITEIHATNDGLAVLMRAVLGPSVPEEPTAEPTTVPEIPPTPVSIATCIGPSPGPQFVCIGSVWVSSGSVVVGGPNSTTDSPKLIISGPTTVIGDVSVQPGSTVVVVLPVSSIGGSDSGIPLLNVTGCFSSSGALELELDKTTWDEEKKKLDGRQVILISSSCDMSSIALSAVKTPSDCRKLKTSTKSEPTSDGRFSFVATFTVDSSRCSLWWIVLVAVLGSVLLIVGVVIIVFTILKKKNERKSVAALRKRPTSVN